MLAHSYFIKDPYRKSFHYTISAYFVLFFRFFILVSLLPCFRAEFSVDSWKLSVVCDNGQEQQVSVLQATESLWLSVQAVSHEIHGDHTKTNEKKKTVAIIWTQDLGWTTAHCTPRSSPFWVFYYEHIFMLLLKFWSRRSSRHCLPAPPATYCSHIFCYGPIEQTSL